MGPLLLGLLTAAFIALVGLVLIAVLVCLLLVAAIAVLLLLERTGVDVPAAAGSLRQRIAAGRTPGPARPAGTPPDRAAEAGSAADAREPWSRRTPGTPVARPRTPQQDSPASAATSAADRPTASAPTEVIDPAAAPVPPAPAGRTGRTPASRPARRPKPPVEPEAPVDRDAAMDRLFAPLTESDRTEPLPPRGPRGGTAER